METLTLDLKITNLLRSMEEECKKVLVHSKDSIMRSIKPHLTAIKRTQITVPLRKALNIYPFDGKIGIDFGCGKSIDSDHLNEIGIQCYKYDIYFHPLNQLKIELDPKIASLDYVLLIYVLNVVPPEIRKIIANTAKKMVENNHGFIVLGVRDDFDAIQCTWRPYKDGFITQSNTFQCFFENNEIGAKKMEELFPDMRAYSMGRGAWIIYFEKSEIGKLLSEKKSKGKIYNEHPKRSNREQ